MKLCNSYNLQKVIELCEIVQCHGTMWGHLRPLMCKPGASAVLYHSCEKQYINSQLIIITARKQCNRGWFLSIAIIEIKSVTVRGSHADS